MQTYEPVLVTIATLNARYAALRERRRHADVNSLPLPLFVNRPAPAASDADVEALAQQEAA